MTLPIGQVLVVQQLSRRELASALPNAPVVPDRPRRPVPLRRTRTVTASALHRAAARIAPAC